MYTPRAKNPKQSHSYVNKMLSCPYWKRKRELEGWIIFRKDEMRQGKQSGMSRSAISRFNDGIMEKEGA